MTTEFDGCDACAWDACGACDAWACDCDAAVAAVVAAPGRGASVTVLWTPESAGSEDAAALGNGAVEFGALEGAAVVDAGGEEDAMVALALDTNGKVVWDAAFEEARIVILVEEELLEPRGNVSLLFPAAAEPVAAAKPPVEEESVTFDPAVSCVTEAEVLLVAWTEAVGAFCDRAWVAFAG